MFRFATVALVGFLVFPAAAQVRENVNVEVVQVPVYITARDGHPVTGLTKDAFQLSVDGHPQAIDYFDVIDFAAVPSGSQTVERPRRERRLYLLLFDLTFATPNTIMRAQRAAQKAVATSNPATDFFAVATYSSNHGVRLLSPFLSDRVAVSRALYTLKSNDANDPLGLAIGSAERVKWVTALGQGGAASGADEDVSSFIKDAGRLGVGSDLLEILQGGWAVQDMKRESANHLIEYQLEGLGEAASRLAPLEGQKHLLVFTEGFDSTNVTDIKVRNQNPTSQNPFLSAGMNFEQAPPNMDPRLLDVVKKMHETFVSAGVTLDSIDIKGVRHTFDNLENDALYMLSRGTGGRVIVNRNDLSEAIGTVMQAQRVAYMLGFRQGEKKRGRISVRVNGLPRGAEVSYREGFGYEQQTTALDTLQLADIVLNDVPQSGVTLSGGVTPSATGAEVAVSFARAEVVPQLVEGSPSVQILLYVFDEHGVAVGFKSKLMSFSAAARETAGYVTLREPFELPKGKYMAKVLLRITGTRSLGFVRRDFAVE